MPAGPFVDPVRGMRLHVDAVAGLEVEAPGLVWLPLDVAVAAAKGLLPSRELLGLRAPRSCPRSCPWCRAPGAGSCAQDPCAKGVTEPGEDRKMKPSRSAHAALAFRTPAPSTS